MNQLPAHKAWRPGLKACSLPSIKSIFGIIKARTGLFHLFVFWKGTHLRGVRPKIFTIAFIIRDNFIFLLFVQLHYLSNPCYLKIFQFERKTYEASIRRSQMMNLTWNFLSLFFYTPIFFFFNVLHSVETLGSKELAKRKQRAQYSRLKKIGGHF